MADVERSLRPPEIHPEPEKETKTEQAPLPAEKVEVPESPTESLRTAFAKLAEARRPRAPEKLPQEKDALVLKIESVLSDGLDAEFAKMSPQRQLSFRHEGEELAVRMKQMLGHGNVDAALANKQIARWLRGIPDVGALFLEQATKIKTDKLRHLT